MEPGTERVGMTELGKERNPKLAERIGVVYGPSRYPNTIRVLWDGNRSPNAYHRSYIRVLAPGEAPSAAPEPAAEPASERRWRRPRRR
jgi:hypothetical protein